MASSPITSWQIEGGKVEVVTDFLFLGSKFTTDGDCGHNIRRPLPLGRKTVTNLCAEKQRHHFADKGLYSQGYGLPSGRVWLWESERRKKSEVTQSCPTLCDPWTVAHQAPPSMGFSRQEFWNGLPFPSPGDLPDPGIEPGLHRVGHYWVTVQQQQSTSYSYYY